MVSMNHVVLLGHLGADPKLSKTQAKKAVANLSIATNTGWKDQEGEKRERTDWHSVVVWGAQAERCAQHLEKGRLVLVTGRLQSRTWEDDEGNRRYSTEVVASRVEFLDRPKESEQCGG